MTSLLSESPDAPSSSDGSGVHEKSGDELTLTSEEKAIQQYLMERLPTPQNSIFDTVNTRIARLEPLVQDIEKMLKSEDFKNCIDRPMRRRAERALTNFQAQKSMSQSSLFGRIPMFALIRSVNDLGSDLEGRYLDLKMKISGEWRAQILFQAYKRELKGVEPQLKKQNNDLYEATENLRSVHTQIAFGQFVVQNTDDDGLLKADVDDNDDFPIIYVDFSGERQGKRAQGSFGSIHNAWTSRNKLESAGVFVVKVPRAHRTGRNELSREGDVWKYLQVPKPHPNILELYGTCQIGGQFTGLISRWVPGGKSWKDSLLDFDENQNIAFLERTADALKWMHEKIVVHGDVKLANVIISREPLKPLLCDFGYSLRRELDDTQASVKGGGSGPYVSPEVYKGDRKTFASDIWAFGVCIVHALTQRLPFAERMKDVEDIREEYYRLFITEKLRPSRPSDLTPAGSLAWSVALACINDESAARPETREHSKRLDAERVADGRPVFLKLAPKSSPEITIGRLLASPDLIKDPRNRCAPLLDVLEDPVDIESVILVFPLLRRLDHPRPTTVGEFVPMIQQTLETLAFLHENEIAHRDCAFDNIMMDGRAIYPEGWHPQSFLRARQYPKTLQPGSIRDVEDMSYYFIDFGLATYKQNLTTGMDGQERAPELSDIEPYDPYKLDVYILGMAFRRFFQTTYQQTDFKYLQPITDYMTVPNPSARPTAKQSYERFKEVLAAIPKEELSRRLSPLQEESFTQKLWNDLDHFIWTSLFSRWVTKRKAEPLV
ncbi:hypothetical protein FRB90_012409 [Tulasnella sp. 427]|nr:hypothetical protein FRB90_012409 [Tulasnella sp. 427]